MNSSIFFSIQNSYPIFFNSTLSKSTAIEVPSIAVIVPIPNSLFLTFYLLTYHINRNNNWWLWNNWWNICRFAAQLFLSSNHLHVLFIHVLTTRFEIFHILKYKHGRFLYIIIRPRTDRKHPNFTRNSILARLCFGVRFVNSLKRATARHNYNSFFFRGFK